MPAIFLTTTTAALLLMMYSAVGSRNVLFLVSDDMRPQLNNAYGQSFMYTPNLDKLAREGMVFDRHYTNFAICSASRNSFLSGRMPDKAQVWNFINHFRESRYFDNDIDATLPQYFKMNGYSTLGAGKLFHPNKPPNNDIPYSWTGERPYFPPYVGDGWNLNCTYPGASVLSAKKGAVCVEPDFKESANGKPFLDNIRFADYNESTETALTIQAAASTYKKSQKPFFIGLGVTKPHYSWNVPDYFYKMYMDAPLALHQSSPKGVPDIAFTGELDGMTTIGIGNSKGIPNSEGPAEFNLPIPGNNSFPGWFQSILRAGYWSAISLADHHLGIALDALDSTGLASETLTIFTADHGYQLGEHTEWAKHTNFELGVHIPLIIRAPWLKNSVGAHTSMFTSLIDIYRTTASLAGLSPPSARVDGKDFSSLLRNPSDPSFNAAFSQYSRCPGARWWPNIIPNAPGWELNNCEMVPAPNITAMGYSVRVQGYRYTAWFEWIGSTCRANFKGEPKYGRELYVHNDSETFPLDFDCCENENVVGDPAFEDTVKELHTMILEKYDDDSLNLGCPPLQANEK